MERFVIDAAVPAAEPTKAGMAWLLDETVGMVEEGAIVVPSVAAISNLGGVLGPDELAEAKRDRRIAVGVARIAVLTPKKLPPKFLGPIFVPWADRKTAEKAEALQPRKICATGWVPEDFEAWCWTWGPTDLATGDVVADGPGSEAGFEAPIVDSITHPSGGSSLGNTYDKKRAINGFKALRELELPFDPAKARMIARRRGWTTEAADRLEETARKISKGEPVQGGDRMTKTMAEKIVKGLEELAKDPPDSD